MAKEKTLGTRDEFHSDRCFKKYLYAVKMGTKINYYLDKKYLVFDGTNDLITGRMKFYFMGKPTVGEVRNGKGNNSTYDCCSSYFCTSYDKQGKIWIDVTMVEIKDFFSKFKIINPKHIKRLRL